MLRFEPFDLKHREAFLEIAQSARTLACVRSFAFVYMWRELFHVQVCIRPEAVYFACGQEHHDCFIMPLLAGSAEQALEVMMENAREEGKRFRLRDADEEMMLAAQKKGLYIRESLSSEEYLYNAEDLIQLTGKKYHSKRNFITRFRNENEFVYERITKESIPECLELAERWKNGKEDKYIDAENQALRTALEHMDDFGLLGALIRVNGEVRALTVGERAGDMGIVHFEKAEAEITGLYAAINNFFAQDVFGEMRYINRQEDMGLEGLRKAKQSYHPVALVKKFEIADYPL